MSNRSEPETKVMGAFPSTDAVVLERRLPGSMEQAWGYLTRPPLMARWLAGGTIDLRVGGVIDLDFDLIDCPGREDAHGAMRGVITECEPPRLIGYSWDESGAGGPASSVKFELRPEREGWTVLTLTHCRLAPNDMSPVAAGWHVHLDVLGARLAGDEPGHFMHAWGHWEPRYRALLQKSA